MEAILKTMLNMMLKKIKQLLIMNMVLGMAISLAQAQTTESTIYVCTQADGRIKLQNTSLTKNCTTKTVRITEPVRLPREVKILNDPQPAQNAIIIGSRVSQQMQSQRDAGREAILRNELFLAQALLAKLESEYQNGAPERRGDERNYQKYLDRTEQLRQKISLTQANISALSRELSRMP